MKKGIHPENYRTVLFYDSNAKQGFLIRSCARTTTTMKWEDGNEIASEGRASEFASRYGKFGSLKSK